MAVGTIIGAILAGVGTVLSKTWDTAKDVITHFFQVMPAPLRFFFFLYMIIFLTSTIMPVFLGMSTSCDSTGGVYKINFVTLQQEAGKLDNLAEMCSGNYTSSQTFTEFASNAIDLKRISSQIWNYIGKILGDWFDYKGGKIYANSPECIEFNSFINSTNTTVTKDAVLKKYGEKVSFTGYKNLVHVGCTFRDDEFVPALMFYTTDLFSLELWLLIGVCGLLIPLSVNWYRIVLKR